MSRVRYPGAALGERLHVAVSGQKTRLLLGTPRPPLIAMNQDKLLGLRQSRWVAHTLRYPGGQRLEDRVEAKPVLHEKLHLLPLSDVSRPRCGELPAQHLHRSSTLRADPRSSADGQLERLAAVEADEGKAECLHILALGKAGVMPELVHRATVLVVNLGKQQSRMPETGHFRSAVPGRRPSSSGRSYAGNLPRSLIVAGKRACRS